MNKIKIERESKVFIYGNSNLNKCSKEDNLLFFDKTIDPLTILKNGKKNNFTTNKINITNSIPKSKKIDLNKVITSLGLSLFISLNPNNSMALSYLNTLNTISSTGEDIISAFGTGVIKVVSIITVIRLLNELLNGGNEYRLFRILKECLGVILAVILIPKIPLIVSIIIK